MKIAICDDKKNDIDHLKSCIESYPQKQEIYEFKLAADLLYSFVEGEHFDILFLDINLPDANGWVLAKELKQSFKKIFIILISVVGTYIFDSFDRSSWFIVKPISVKRTHQILDHVTNELFPNNIKFENGIEIYEINPAVIIYAEVTHNNTIIHTLTKKYKIRMSLTDFILKTNQLYFVKTHKSFVINIRFYKSLSNNDIILKNGTYIPLSRNMRKQFLEELREYARWS